MSELDFTAAEDPRLDGGEITDIWTGDESGADNGYLGADAITATEGDDEIDDDQPDIAAAAIPVEAEAAGKLATASMTESVTGANTDRTEVEPVSPAEDIRTDEPADEQVGATLSRLHQASGMPLDKLAERTGVPAGTLADFFGGQTHNGAGYSVLLSTLQVLNVPGDQANTLIDRYAATQNQRRNQAA
jgi:hypothetical protein